jgi:CheY-like chemotaxis protein
MIHDLPLRHHGLLDTLPEQALGDPAAATASAPRRGEGQRILYLDDEEPLVFLAKRMLEGLGYRVTGFSRPADAVEAFRAHPDQFDLVITDLNMPGTSGLQVAVDLLKLRPDMPVVLSTGHVTEDLEQRARDAGIREVLYKPHTMAEFSQAIHRLATRIRPP